MQILSAFGGGLIIVPLLMLTGIIIFGYKGYKASKSNSTTQSGTTTIDNTGNVPFYKTGYGVLAILLTVVLIATIIYMYSER